jgi:peptide/nickel transport system substrate-binding protein
MSSLGVLLLLLACASQRPSGTATDGSLTRPERLPANVGGGSAGFTDAQQAASGAASLDKTLVIGIAAEVRAFSTLNGEQNKYVEDLIVGNLFLQDEGGRWFPAIAAETPSIRNGTWMLHPDGSSDIIYKIKPGVKWHDGVEFTVHDFVFSWRIGRDTDLPFEGRDKWLSISAMEPLDDYTLKVTWAGPEAEADTVDHRILWPKPRHILEPVYSRDKQEILAHPYWSTEFVGLGPYKVSRFVHGSHLELTANENYALGSPKIKNVVVRFYNDSNVLISALLAGDVHITLHGARNEGALAMSEGIFLTNQWRASQEGKVLFNPTNIELLSIQWQPEYQKPAALADIRVRQALLHAMNRQALVDQLFSGFTDVAHGWLPPDDPDFKSFEDAITRYEFDPARAQALLAEAGWTRGADGVLVNARGERFELEYRAQGREQESIATAVADFWKQVGIDTQLLFIPSARARDHEWMAKFSGIRNHRMVSLPVGGAIHRYSCLRVPTAANSWLFQTTNPGGYCSEEMQTYWRQVDSGFPFDARMAPFKEMMRVALKDLPNLPLYFEAEPVAVRSNVTGVNRVPPKNRGRIAMHAYTWTLQ